MLGLTTLFIIIFRFAIFVFILLTFNNLDDIILDIPLDSLASTSSLFKSWLIQAVLVFRFFDFFFLVAALNHYSHFFSIIFSLNHSEATFKSRANVLLMNNMRASIFLYDHIITNLTIVSRFLEQLPNKRPLMLNNKVWKLIYHLLVNVFCFTGRLKLRHYISAPWNSRESTKDYRSWLNWWMQGCGLIAWGLCLQNQEGCSIIINLFMEFGWSEPMNWCSV